MNHGTNRLTDTQLGPPGQRNSNKKKLPLPPSVSPLSPCSSTSASSWTQCRDVVAAQQSNTTTSRSLGSLV